MSEITSTSVDNYREELMVSLSSAWKLAVETIQKAQARYKKYYDRKAMGSYVQNWGLDFGIFSP